MTQQRILAALAGCSSTNPMLLDTLAEKTGLPADALRTELERMQHSLPAPINSATVTRAGVTVDLYCPTGVIATPIPFRRYQDNLTRAAIAKREAQPNTETKQEHGMTTTQTPRNNRTSPLRIALEQRIASQPGVTVDELIEHARKAAPGATVTQVKKALSNIVHVAHSARSEGSYGALRYYPAGNDKSDAKSGRKHKEEPKEKPGHAPAPPESEVKPAATATSARSDEFSVMLSDDNHLHISVGDEQFMLNPDQAGRLQKFLSRVNLVEGWL